MFGNCAVILACTHSYIHELTVIYARVCMKHRYPSVSSYLRHYNLKVLFSVIVSISIFFRQYQERVRTVARAFIKLGLERYHSVCILGFNSEQWFVADLAAIHAGLVFFLYYHRHLSWEWLLIPQILILGTKFFVTQIIKITSALPELKQ